MIDVANLVLEVDSRDVEQGRQALTRLAKTGTEASNELATALKRSEKEFHDLKRSIDPAYRASVQYKEAVETVRRAVRTGAITQDEANRALQQVATQYRVTSAAAEQYGMAVSRAGTGSSRFGLAVQNASFQVADFAVMVGSGMGVTRAFATQLPQLLGPLGMWGALLGAVVAIGGALVPVFMNAGDAAETSTRRFENLGDAISALGSVSEASAAEMNAYLVDTFGQFSERVQSLIEDLRAAEYALISAEMRRGIESQIEQLNRLGGAFEVFWADFMDPGTVDPGYLEQTQEIIRNAGIAYDDFLRLDEAVKAVFQADSVDGFISALANARSIAEEIGGPVGDQVAQALLRAADEAGVLNRVTSEASGHVGSAANEASRLADELMRAASNAMSLAQQSAFGVTESEIRLRLAGDPVAQARELAGARFDYQVGDITGMDPVVQQGLAQQREAYIANAEAIARNQQALADWNAAQRSGGGAAREFNRELERARDLYTELSSGHERFQAELDLLRQQFDNGTISLDTYIERLGELKDAMTANERTAKNLENAFANTATSIVMGSESASSAVSRLLNQLAQMALNAAFQSLFGGMFGGLSWLFTPSAMGNVFAQGNIVPFANGGVVSGPTVFPMAGRSTGLMGEAGPEAIMPLSRGPDGKLGVAAGGEQTIRLVVEAEEGELFVPRVRQISGQTAVQVSRNTARAQQRAFPATLDEYDRRGTT